MADDRFTDLDKALALHVAEMDRRGFTLCEQHGEFFFRPKDQYRSKRAA
jgi:hypothetical protein